MKSVTSLHTYKVVGRKEPTDHGQINNVASGFRTQHPILEHTMGILRRTYNPNGRTSSGPEVITAAVESWPHVNCQHSNCVTIVGTAVCCLFISAKPATWWHNRIIQR